MYHPGYVVTPDYYGELGVDPSATLEEIRRAFTRLGGESSPEAMASAPEADRAAAAARTERLLAAWTVLASETDRLLYDQCLAKGYDFERVHTLVVAETEAEHAAQAARAQVALAEALKATARDLERAIRKLDPGLRWAEGDRLDYFDAVLLGTAPLRWARIHLRVLPVVDLAAITGSAQYAARLLDVTQPDMTRISDSFLLVGSAVSSPAEVGKAVLDFNVRHWQKAAPRKPRSMLAYAAAGDRTLRTPGVPNPDPDLRKLAL